MEAQLVFFTFNNGKWEYRNEPTSEIPFFSTSPSFHKKPVLYDMEPTEAFNNSSYNKLLDSVMNACADTGPWRGWLVFFFFLLLFSLDIHPLLI